MSFISEGYELDFFIFKLLYLNENYIKPSRGAVAWKDYTPWEYIQELGQIYVINVCKYIYWRGFQMID